MKEKTSFLHKFVFFQMPELFLMFLARLYVSEWAWPRTSINNNNNNSGFLYSAQVRHAVTLKALQHY